MHKRGVMMGSVSVSLGRESVGMPFGRGPGARVGFVVEGRGEAIYPGPDASAKRVRSVRAAIVGRALSGE